MKGIVIYYSLEGNTKMMASTISERMNFDILELIPKKNIPTKGFLKYLLGGKQVVRSEQPELMPFKKNFEQYDVIVFGSPVWASSYASPFNSFFSEVSIQNKNIALFCCYLGNEGKTFDNFKKQLEGNKIIGQIGFKNTLKTDRQKNIHDVEEWINGICKNSNIC